MAGRGNPTFQKRQKEQNRLEKRQEKAARKMQRKTMDKEPGTEDSDLFPLEQEETLADIQARNRPTADPLAAIAKLEQ